MLFNFKRTISKRSVYFITLLVSGITMVALIILSYLLAQESLKNNEEFARKSFFNKYEAIQYEFENILAYQDIIQGVIKKSPNHFAFEENLKVLNEINTIRDLNIKNWTSIDKTTLLKDQFYQEKNNFYTQSNDSIYWKNYDSISLPNQSYVYYGFSINLMDLHDYFIEINQNSSNYVYVFDKNGFCLTHPDEKYIGKNVFDFTSIEPKDTVTTEKSLNYSEQNTISEYLTNTEITRFIKPIRLKGLDGYVAIGHLNFLTEENVFNTKLYVSIIFLITIGLVTVIFLLFNHLTRKSFEEKEAIVFEKNKLLVENERINKENAINQLKQLKNQINPHFLFNSLNTLYMTIGLNPKQAQRFTMNLSRIYRYLIVPPKDNRVPVEKEINFIQQYMELQKDRFQEELIFQLTIEDTVDFNQTIPYLALQLVVENAIKHNKATVEEPLTISIRIIPHQLIVTNSYQPKTRVESSTNFGLDYLQQIYQYYNVTSFSTSIDNGLFVCVLPLMD